MASAPKAGEYTVVARRYRPQQFTALVGQESVAKALSNAIASGRIAHAYLFTGTRGVGKTSTARILAKALNCVNGPTPTPCDVCEICRSITAGDDLDVVEIDGASNRGIDEIRAIRQNAQFRPGRARYKIYIIDEVHMLSREAFNALLKTLEEPPLHVKFILATTDVHKVPITILSRCQRFDFGSIRPERIVEQLRDVVRAEGREAEETVLAVIARRAAGSMRDAQSLLEQLLAGSGQQLTLTDVQMFLGTAAEESVLAIAGAILERDPVTALRLLDDALGAGIQPGELLDQLIDYWRDLMVVRAAGAEAPDLSTLITHRDELQQRADAASLDGIMAGLDILTATKARMRGSSYAKLLFEMAVIRLARLDDLLSLGQIAHSLASGGVAVPTSSAQPAPGSGVPKKKPESGFLNRSVVAKEPKATVTQAISPESLPSIWAELLTQVGFLTANELRHAGLPAILGPNTLALTFPSGYTASYEYCSEVSRVQVIEKHLSRLTGQTLAVKVSKGTDRPAEKRADKNLNSGTAVAPNPPSRERRKAEILNDPLIQRAIEILGAQPLSVDEGFGSPARPTVPPPVASDALTDSDD